MLYIKQALYISTLFLLLSCNNDNATKFVNKNITPLTQSWEKAVPNQNIPEGLTSLSAEQCGACHQQHYKEWKLSTHANAWTDLQFQAELKKDSSPFLCINCHIPLQNQQEYLIKGLIDGDIYQPVKEKNPYFDKALQQEGINCVSCHVRNNVIIGPTGSQKAPHKTIKDTKFLSEQLCISCHNANAVVTSTLACTFQTGDEWKSGPFYGKKNCIDCHMEETQREIVAGFGKRKSRFHSFPGSGIPKRKGLKTTILNGLVFYPSKISHKYKLKDSLIYTLKAKNENAGHRVPTGDPERFFIIKFELLDASGKIIYSKKDRVGEEWDWYPEAKKLNDNNINPGEERLFNFSEQLNTKGIYQLKVNVTKHRMTQKTAQYNKLGKEYSLFINVFNKSYEFEVN